MICLTCFYAWKPRVFSPKNCPKCGYNLNGYGGGYRNRNAHNIVDLVTAASDIKLGARVRKQGYPVMTVSKIHDSGVCACAWGEGVDLKESWFLTSTLELV